MAFRTRRHHLHQRAPRRALLKVVAAICGMQAQVMSSVELALWARIEGLTPADVRDALCKQRRLVKTWAMRGTLHVLRADDYLRWQRPLGIMPITRSPDGFSVVDSRQRNSMELSRQSAAR
jgi:hypothetical protein